MSLSPIRPGLRTIHNGTRDVAKASIVVPAGGELTVPDDVAAQLQRDGAFKDGPTPASLTDVLDEEEAAAKAAADAERAAVLASFAPTVADRPVEQATAAPGEKRAVKKVAAKPVAAKSKK
jgi:hypothetical protein